MKFFDRVNLKLFGFYPTYSQCGEDRILRHVFRMLKKEKIHYIDIGANHPYYGSNTYLFYVNGSSGICIEPNTKLHNLIKSKRSRDLCLNIGVGNKTEGELEFYIIHPDTLSTFSKEDAEELDKQPDYRIEQVVKVPVLSFNDIVDKYSNGKHLDLVSIDVEGLNEEIVESIDLVKNRPTVFCIETITFSTTGEGVKLQGINDKLLSNGYMIYSDTHINTIYIDTKSWKEIQ